MPKPTIVQWAPPSNNAEQEARELVSAVMYLHTTFKDEVWLWRGQAVRDHNLEPGMHTRIRRSLGRRADEAAVAAETSYLLKKAREAGIDRVNGTRLPDLALLATLQHYGAATPLLDVTVDPLVALWMIAFASPESVDALDQKTGALFAIKRPTSELTLTPLDARRYLSATEPSISVALSDKVWWYRAPDVTERLRIQRGSFLLGPFRPLAGRTTLPLQTETAGKNWLENRLTKRGQRGNNARATTDVGLFRVRGGLKPYLRKLLSERSGLDTATVFPTPWERPFIEQFARGYGRARLLDPQPQRSERSPTADQRAPSPTLPS